MIDSAKRLSPVARAYLLQSKLTLIGIKSRVWTKRGVRVYLLGLGPDISAWIDFDGDDSRDVFAGCRIHVFTDLPYSLPLKLKRAKMVKYVVLCKLKDAGIIDGELVPSDWTKVVL